MKFIKLQLVLLALLLLGSKAIAQDDQIDNLKFEGSEAEEIKPPYFAIGGGFLGNFYFANFKDLNDKTKALGLPDLKSPMFIYGGEGFTALPFVPNLRLGFVGMGGTTSTTSDVNGTSKGLEYSVAYTGFAIDYGIILFTHFVTVPGITAGWGNVAIESWQNSGEQNWNDIITPNAPRTSNYLDRAKANFFFLQPNLNFEYAIAPYLMFRLNFSYSLSFIGKDAWQYDRGSKINGVPSSLNANGFNVQLGVFGGLFNY